MYSEGTIIKNQIRSKIKELEEEYDIELSTTQKILLSINGPITTILDVLYGEVKLFMLGQHVEEANEDIAKLLNIDEGEEVDYREVIVHKCNPPWFMHCPMCQYQDVLKKLLMNCTMKN